MKIDPKHSGMLMALIVVSAMSLVTSFTLKIVEALRTE